MSADLQRALSTLAAKAAPLAKLRDYYEGDHPVVYTNERLRKVFRNLDAKFTENWCAVVIDSVADRIGLCGFDVSGSDAGREKLQALWAGLSLGVEADDAHETALICGEAYLIAWLDPETDEPLVCCNDPGMAHVFYDPENPRRKRFAAKWWNDDDGHRCVTLYYPERFEYYRSLNPVSKGGDATKAANYGPRGEMTYDGKSGQAPNDTGIIPVFHLRNVKCRSDLKNVVPIQNGVNKLLIDMMVSAEYAAFQQRWIISHADTESLKCTPDGLWHIPAGDGTGQATQVGQFEATDLDNYLKPIDSLVTAAGAITRTPKHFFFQQGGDPSGEALLAQESPLVKKAKDRIERFRPVWQELGHFLLQLVGMNVPRAAVLPLFDPAETTQPATQSEIRERNVKAGIPLRTQLRDEGWTDKDLAQLDKDRAADAAAQQTDMASALVDARARFDRGE